MHADKGIEIVAVSVVDMCLGVGRFFPVGHQDTF